MRGHYRGHLTNSCNTDQGKKNKVTALRMKEPSQRTMGTKGDRETMQRVQRGTSGQAWRHRM